jgi:hypothetical protein
MTSWLLPYLVLGATLGRALFVAANLAPKTCYRCGLKFERQELGERVCGCRRASS